MSKRPETEVTLTVMSPDEILIQNFTNFLRACRDEAFIARALAVVKAHEDACGPLADKLFAAVAKYNAERAS